MTANALLSSFMDFYLKKVDDVEGPLGRLKKLNRKYRGFTRLFMGELIDPSTVDDLYEFYEAVHALPATHCIKMGERDNICFDFFVDYVSKEVFGGRGPDGQSLHSLPPERAASIQKAQSLAKPGMSIEDCNYVRRVIDDNRSLLLKKEQVLGLEELVAIGDFSSGGENLLLKNILAPLLKYSLNPGKPGMRFLDAGCGAGFSSIVLGSHEKIVGIDSIDNSEIRVRRFNSILERLRSGSSDVKENLIKWYKLEEEFWPCLDDIVRSIAGEADFAKKIKAVKGSVSETGLKDGSLDGIICIEVLEHTYDPSSAVQEFARILRSGGVAYVTVPSYFAQMSETLYGLIHGQVLTPCLHLQHYNELSLAELFTANDFSPLTVEPIEFIQLQNSHGHEGDLSELLGKVALHYGAGRESPHWGTLGIFRRNYRAH